MKCSIDAFHEYCRLWTKQRYWFLEVEDFLKILSFESNGLDIEIVYEFNYLGIVFITTGNFNVTKKCMVDKATRALYEVLKLGRMYKLKKKFNSTFLIKWSNQFYYTGVKYGRASVIMILLREPFELKNFYSKLHGLRCIGQIPYLDWY